MNTRKIGQLGEDIGRKFLETRGYLLLTRNYHCRFGELDLVMRDTDDKEIVFVEVKMRHGNLFGLPQESVTAIKRKHLLKSAYCFLRKNKLSIDSGWRIDLLALELKTHDKILIRHYKNILNGT